MTGKSFMLFLWDSGLPVRLKGPPGNPESPHQAYLHFLICFSRYLTYFPAGIPFFSAA